MSANSLCRIRATNRHLLGATLAVGLLAGCSHKHTGPGTVTTSGANLDASWVTAANACWPDLAKQGYSTNDLRRNLGAPATFRTLFPVYSALTNADIDNILAKPIEASPSPDNTRLAHSQYPVLNRFQAAQGAGSQLAVVQSTNGQAPPDAFCAIQPGVPQGLSK
jgi:hypothetical protein